MNEAIPGAAIAPVVKTLLVQTSPAKAFEVFTAEIDRWWPRATHSVSQERTKLIVFECRIGGSIHEVSDDDAHFEWGRVMAWDPPHRVVFTWYPGREATADQQVEVRFDTEGPGTRVTLTHTGWEALGAHARAAREGYDHGWETVFTQCYGEACQS